MRASVVVDIITTHTVLSTVPTGRSHFVGNSHEAYGTNEILTLFVPHMYVKIKCLRILS